MKIYEQIPTYLVRVQINKIGDERQYVTFCETTPDEVEEMCKRVIEEQKLSPFEGGHRTRIDIRECLGAKNGKSRSLSFRGLDTATTLKLILDDVNKQNNEFSAEDIKRFDQRRESRLSGKSKTYSWQDAKDMIGTKKGSI